MWANCLFPRNNLWDFRQLWREFHAIMSHYLFFTTLQNVEGFGNSIVNWQTTHPQWQNLQRRRGRRICVCREHLQDCHAAQPPSHWGHLLCWGWNQKQGLTVIMRHTPLKRPSTCTKHQEFWMSRHPATLYNGQFCDPNCTQTILNDPNLADTCQPFRQDCPPSLL